MNKTSKRVRVSKSYIQHLSETGQVCCEVCGWIPPIEPTHSKQNLGAGLNVHHVVHRACNGSDEIDNLVCLCPNHHAVAHLMGKSGIHMTGPTEKATLVKLLRELDTNPNAYNEWVATLPTTSEVIGEIIDAHARTTWFSRHYRDYPD